MLKTGNIKPIGRHLLLSGVAPAVTGILLIILSLNYVRFDPWDTVLVTVGSVLVGVGVFDVVFRLVAFQHFVNDLSSTVLRALQLPIHAFYESRSHLDSVDKELSGAEEIWAAWHVGPYRDFEAFFPLGRRGRIILTNPSSAALKELSKVRKGDVDTMASVIRNITKHALEKDLEVRWFDGPVCNNVIIVDPKKDRAWMRVELVVPHESPQKRPSFLVEKDSNEGLYETFCSSFNKMWEAGQPPEMEASEREPEEVGVAS